MKQTSALPLTEPPASTESWYLSAMERLVVFVQDRSHARDLDAVTAVVRDAARNLTGADGATFVLRDGDNCYYAEENAIAPLWEGLRFPMSQCVSGWVMVNTQSVVTEDIYDDLRVPVEAYRPTFVKSMAMVPIRRTSPIGAIGNYWSTHRLPSAEELAVLQALADTTSLALENAEPYTRLQGMIRRLQDQQIRIGEQHASLGILARALAHDLREPVRTLVSFSEMLQEVPQDQETQATYLRFISDSAARMGTLIDPVAHYTRLDSPEISACSLCLLNDVVAEAPAGPRPDHRRSRNHDRPRTAAHACCRSGPSATAAPEPRCQCNPPQRGRGHYFHHQQADCRRPSPVRERRWKRHPAS